MKKSSLFGAAVLSALLATAAHAENGWYAGGALTTGETDFALSGEGTNEYFLNYDRFYSKQDVWTENVSILEHSGADVFAGYRRDLKTFQNGITAFGRIEGGLSFGSGSSTMSGRLGEQPYEINVERGMGAYGAVHLGVEKNGWRAYGLGGLSMVQHSITGSFDPWTEMQLDASDPIPFGDIGLGIERDISDRMAVRLEAKHSIGLENFAGKANYRDNNFGADYVFDGDYTATTMAVGLTFKF